jgi:hypothetical protein
MSNDIARLGYEIDSSQARTAAGDLDKMGAAASRAAGSADVLAKANNGIATATKATSKTAFQLAQAQRDVARMFDTTSTRATAMGNSMQVAAGHARTLGRANQVASQHTTNLLFQFQDIAMMLASGQNPLMLAMQQGTQVAGVFHQMKASGQSAFSGIVGGLAAMISPMSLLTIGTIAGGAALTQWAYSAIFAGDEAEEAEEAIDNFVSSLDAAISMANRAGTPIDELAEKFGHFADEIQRASQIAAQAALSQAMLGLSSATKEIRKDLTDVSAALVEYQRQVANLEIVQSSLGERTLSNASAFDEAERNVRDAAVAMSEAASEMGLTSSQAISLQIALDQLASAEGMEGVANSASKALDLIGGMFDETQNIPPEVAAIVLELERVLSAAAAGTIAFDDMAGAASGAADQAGRLAENLRIAAQVGVTGFRNDPSQIPGEGATEAVAEQRRANLASSFRISSRGSGGGGGGSGGGGGGIDTRQRELEAFIRSLQTERETLEVWRSEQLELLAQFTDAELEMIGGKNESKLRLEQEYQERLSAMRNGYQGSALEQTATFMGEMASALAGGNEKMAAISQVFAGVEATINAYRAFNQVLSDPSLPWFAKIPAAVGVLSAGMKTVQAIKSLGSSGSSGGTSSVSGISGTSASLEPERVVRLEFNGPAWAREMAEQMATQLFEASRDGTRVVLAR